MTRVSPDMVRAMRRDVALADDVRLRRIVAMLDDLPARGEADALLVPARPRIAALRPPRPLRLTRLLFMPLDPLIVPARAWREGHAAIPRGAVAPLAAIVAAGLPAADIAAVTALIAGRRSDESAIVASAGARLWPAAAQALARAAPPDGWAAASGIAVPMFRPLADAVAGLWEHGVTLHRLRAAPPDEFVAKQLLAAAQAHGPLGFALMLRLLITRAPGHPAPLLAAEAVAAAALEPVVAQVIEAAVAQITPDAPLSMVATSARRALLLLEGLSNGPVARPQRAARVQAARTALDQACRTRFTALAAAFGQGGPAETAGTAGLEATAVELRRLEAAGRHFGSAPAYESALATAARRLFLNAQLSETARLRIAERLVGPDAALALAQELRKRA